MLLEYQVLNTFEERGIPRKKAEVLSSAILDASKNLKLFNKNYWIHQLEEVGFSEKASEEAVCLIQTIFSNNQLPS